MTAPNTFYRGGGGGKRRRPVLPPRCWKAPDEFPNDSRTVRFAAPNERIREQASGSNADAVDSKETWRETKLASISRGVGLGTPADHVLKTVGRGDPALPLFEASGGGRGHALTLCLTMFDALTLHAAPEGK